MALLAEPAHEQPAELRLVLDDQDAHRSRVSFEDEHPVRQPRTPEMRPSGSSERVS